MCDIGIINMKFYLLKVPYSQKKNVNIVKLALVLYYCILQL
jgi:hypothetical protein